MVRTRRPGSRGQGDTIIRALLDSQLLTLLITTEDLGFLYIMRLESRAEEKLVEERTGNKTSIAVRRAEYRAQANRVLASVYLVFHTYLS